MEWKELDMARWQEFHNKAAKWRTGPKNCVTETATVYIWCNCSCAYQRQREASYEIAGLASLINNDTINVSSSGVIQIAEEGNLAFLPIRVLYVLCLFHAFLTWGWIVGFCPYLELCSTFHGYCSKFTCPWYIFSHLENVNILLAAGTIESTWIEIIDINNIQTQLN